MMEKSYVAACRSGNRGELRLRNAVDGESLVSLLKFIQCEHMQFIDVLRLAMMSTTPHTYCIPLSRGGAFRDLPSYYAGACAL